MKPSPFAYAKARSLDHAIEPPNQRTQLLELAEILGHRLLAEAVDPAARVRDVEQDELDSRLRRRLGRCPRRLQPEVVELSDRGVAGRPQLAVDLDVARSDVSRCLTPGQVQHRLAPRPEVPALGAPAQRPLERMAMRVDETGDPRLLLHARILSTWRLRLPQSRLHSR